MPIIDIILLATRLDDIHNRNVFDRIFFQLKDINVRNIIIAEQNGEVSAHLVNFPDLSVGTISHIPVNMAGDVNFFHRAKLINAGAASATGSDYIWIIDFDVELEFDKVLSEIGNEDLIQPFTDLFVLTEERMEKCLMGAKPKYYILSKNDKRDGTFGAGSLIIKKSLFDSANGFDENYSGTGFEGLEFVYRSNRSLEVFWLNGMRLRSHGFEHFSKSGKEVGASLRLEHGVDPVYFIKRTDGVSIVFDEDKVPDRAKIIPVISNLPGDSAQLAFLDRKKDKISDYVMCWKHDIDFIKKLQSVGKKAIPTIAMSATTLSWGSPRSFNLVGKHQYMKSYVEWIVEHKDEFDYILVGHAYIYTGLPVYNLRIIEEALSEIKEKIIFAPMDWIIEEEAYVYRNDLANAPFRNHILASGKPVLLPCGYWCLYPDLRTMRKEGYLTCDGIPLGYHNEMGYVDPVLRVISGELAQRSIHFNKGDGRIFPFQYFRDYLQGMKVWTGIGGQIGVSHNNITKLIQYGFDACFFVVKPGFDAYYQEWF